MVEPVPLPVALVAPPTKYADTTTAPSARPDALMPVTVNDVDVVDPELTLVLPVTVLPFVSVRVAITVPVSAGPPLGNVTSTETAPLDALLTYENVFVETAARTVAPVGATADKENALLNPFKVPTVASN